MNKKGMTLIEVIVAMAVFGIMSIAVFPAIFLYSRINTISHQIDSASDVSLQEMEKLVGLSDTIQSTYLIQTLIDNGYELVDPSDLSVPTLVYVLEDNVSTYNIELTITFVEDNPYQVLVHIVVLSTGSISGERSEIENILGFTR